MTETYLGENWFPDYDGANVNALRRIATADVDVVMRTRRRLGYEFDYALTITVLCFRIDEAEVRAEIRRSSVQHPGN